MKALLDEDGILGEENLFKRMVDSANYPWEDLPCVLSLNQMWKNQPPLNLHYAEVLVREMPDKPQYAAVRLPRIPR